MTGRIIGHYRIIDKLGEGGMGKVYRAIDTMVEREVAMKSLKPELAARPEVLERFRSEATTLARLNHPNVAQLYSFFKDGNEFYMVMEFVPGKTLETVIQDRGAMPWHQALEIAAQVLDGIQHAHQLGILHRDVKPSNIILLDAGKGTGGFQPAAKIMDFGIAQALGGNRLTREGHLIGTLEYLAPERIQGKPADARSDLYSMAIVLYEMLTAKLPFHSDSEYSLLLAQVQKQPPRPREAVPELPPAVEQTLMRALEKDPNRRYQDAAEFAAALRQHLSPAAVPAASTTVHAAHQIDYFLTEMGRLLRDLPPFPQLVSRFSAALATAWKDTAFRVVTICGLIVMLALSTLLAVIIARKSQAPAVEIAANEEPDPAPAPSTPATPPAVVPETPFLPTNPIPIDQILGGVGAPSQTPATNQPGDGAGTVPTQQQPDGGKSGNPSTPPQAPPRPQGVPAPAAAPPWDSVNTALNVTDGPTSGNAGEWPIHRAGLVGALRIAKAHWRPEIVREVERRGVNFLLTPSAHQALRDAGADNAIVAAVEKSFRSAVVTSARPSPTPTPPPAPAPRPAVRAISRLRDVDTLYVERMKSDLDELLREKIQEELGGQIRLTRDPNAAVARMTAQISEDEGGMLSSAGRIFGLKDKYRVTIRIVATATSRQLWQHETGDKSPIVGAFGSRAMARAVSRIVDRLRDDLEDARN